MGRTTPTTVEFTGYERPWRLASATYSSMMETEGARTFDPVAGVTRMLGSWVVRLRGVLKLTIPLVGVLGRRQGESHLA